MGCLGAFFRHSQVWLDVLRPTGPVQINALAQLCCVLLVNEPVYWNRVIVRVTKVSAAVSIGAPHGLYQPMQVSGAIVTMGRQIPALQYIEHLYEMDTAGGWRRHGINSISTIAPRYGTTLNNPIFDQIAGCDQPIPPRHFIGNQFGNRTAIESIGTSGGDKLQRGRQISLAP